MVNNYTLSKYACFSVCKNEKYLVCVGRGATIYNLDDLSPVHHFGGMPNSTYGYFLDTETLIVTSTTNQIYLHSIPDRNRLWTSKEFSNISKYGTNGRFFIDQEKREIYAILNGPNVEDGYAVAIRPFERAYSVQPLSREPFPQGAVYYNIPQYPDGSISFLHSGTIQCDYKFTCIKRGKPPFHEPFEIAWSQIQLFSSHDRIDYWLHNDTYLIGDHRGSRWGGVDRLICKNWHTDESWELAVPLRSTEYNANIPNHGKWLENGKYLCVYSGEVMYILDFASNRTVARYVGTNLSSAEIVGDKLVLGTWEGVLVYPFPFWMD